MLVTRSRTVHRLQVTSVERFLALSYLSVGPQPQAKATVRIHCRHIGPGKKAQTRILGQVPSLSVLGRQLILLRNPYESWINLESGGYLLVCSSPTVYKAV